MKYTTATMEKTNSIILKNFTAVMTGKKRNVLNYGYFDERPTVIIDGYVAIIYPVKELFPFDLEMLCQASNRTPHTNLDRIFNSEHQEEMLLTGNMRKYEKDFTLELKCGEHTAYIRESLLNYFKDIVSDVNDLCFYTTASRPSCINVSTILVKNNSGDVYGCIMPVKLD